MSSNFDMNEIQEDNYMGTSYDYRSIMQYAPTAFRKRGVKENTMESKFDPNTLLGNAVLSETDIVEFRRKYHCDGMY